MLSYVFMKVLEGRPRSYDRRMDELSGGRVLAMKQSVTENIADGAHVLEIGCGTGELAATMGRRGATVEGFDSNPAMVSAAEERALTEGLADRVHFTMMGVEDMDGLPDDTFDTVVATLVLSEMSDDERRYALRHARRALRPEGVLIIADEVRPRSRSRRALHAAARAPLAAATYVASRSTSRPLRDLGGEVAGAGFVTDREERSHRDAFALLVAHASHAEARS